MPKPIAYKTGSIQPPNTAKQSNILVGVGPANWGAGVANATFYNSVDSSYQYVIIKNSNPPAMWATGDFADASLLTIINGLPERINQTVFTNVNTAINWLFETGVYSMLKSEQLYGEPITNGLVISVNGPSTGKNIFNATTYPDFIGWYDYGGYASYNITNDPPYPGSTTKTAIRGGFGCYSGIAMEVGKQYVFSFWVKAIGDIPSDGLLTWNNQFGSGETNSWVGYLPSSSGIFPTSWTKFSFPFTLNAVRTQFYFYVYSPSTPSFRSPTSPVLFTEFQLEEGSTATNYAIPSVYNLYSLSMKPTNEGLLNTSSLSLANGAYFNTNQGGVFNFDGIDDYAVLTDASLKNYTTITANIWMYVSSTNTWETYFSYNAEEAGLSQGWGVRRQSNVDNYQYWGGTSNTGIKLYKNGVLISSAVATHDTSYGTNKNDVWVMITLVAKGVSSWNTHNRLTIGTRSDSVNSATNMRVGSFNLYNRELSATDIVNLYNSQLPIYQPTAVPVNSGLVLFLDASNPNSYTSGSSTWYDISGYGTNMTLLNSPTFNSANGGFISFDYVDDFGFINVTSGNLLGNVNISMELWIKNPSGNFAMNGIYGGYFSSGFYSGGLLKNSGGASGPNWTSTSSWQQWVAVWDQTLNQTRLYVNGVLTGVSSNTSWSPSTGGKLVFGGGAQGNGTYSKEGSMDIGIYRFYNKVLTQSEITQNYNANKTQFGLS
jgi:hypothetical protein